jgi:Fe-S cluster biogenesis protein NfuA
VKVTFPERVCVIQAYQKRGPMPKFSISTETTPNPATLKFKINSAVTTQSMNFTNVRETECSPLASKIFGFPWASGVFIGPDFVTVTKQDWVDWQILAEPLAGLIAEHFESGLPVFVDLPTVTDDDSIQASDSDEVRTIKTVLQNEIRPMVNLDGGDVAFVKYESNVVYLQMKGACSGCPSSTATLKLGIEVRLKEAVPAIIEVVSI